MELDLLLAVAYPASIAYFGFLLVVVRLIGK